MLSEANFILIFHSRLITCDVNRYPIKSVLDRFDLLYASVAEETTVSPFGSALISII